MISFLNGVLGAGFGNLYEFYFLHTIKSKIGKAEKTLVARCQETNRNDLSIKQPEKVVYTNERGFAVAEDIFYIPSVSTFPICDAFMATKDKQIFFQVTTADRHGKCTNYDTHMLAWKNNNKIGRNYKEIQFIWVTPDENYTLNSLFTGVTQYHYLFKYEDYYRE